MSNVKCLAQVMTHRQSLKVLTTIITVTVIIFFIAVTTSWSSSPPLMPLLILSLPPRLLSFLSHAQRAISEHKSHLSHMAQLRCSLLHEAFLMPTVKECRMPTSVRVCVCVCVLSPLALNYKTFQVTSSSSSLTPLCFPPSTPHLSEQFPG